MQKKVIKKSKLTKKTDVKKTSTKIKKTKPKIVTKTKGDKDGN